MVLGFKVGELGIHYGLDRFKTIGFRVWGFS